MSGSRLAKTIKQFSRSLSILPARLSGRRADRLLAQIDRLDTGRTNEDAPSFLCGLGRFNQEPTLNPLVGVSRVFYRCVLPCACSCKQANGHHFVTDDVIG